tara:strand:+ start:2000 stop:3244 length:1245 start_codon:yes stop_codon:yes gene_type:complete
MLLPVIFLKLWIKGFKLPIYRQRWLERIGIVPFPPLDNLVWVHAVSVGEAISAVPLVKKMLARYPDISILVTTTTPTGSERVQVAFKDMLGKRVHHCFMPYDFPFSYWLFFSRVKPKALVVMETEIWPNLLCACEKREIPITIANGRLSPLSAKRYAWLGKTMQRMVQPIKQVAAQSELDANRFRALGFSPEGVINTGNIKFDFELPNYLQKDGQALREQLGIQRLVWIAASTHEGEEALILDVYQNLKKKCPALLLLLVPRHPDRFNRVAQLCQENKLHVVRRSEKQSVTNEVDIFLGDSMGEMMLFYAASDIAFVGGSLEPIGGHNLLEPAALGLPTLTGNHLFNFIEISEKLADAQGVVIINNAKALESNLWNLIKEPDNRRLMGARAKAVVVDNKGALEELLALLDKYMI